MDITLRVLLAVICFGPGLYGLLVLHTYPSSLVALISGGIVFTIISYKG